MSSRHKLSKTVQIIISYIYMNEPGTIGRASAGRQEGHLGFAHRSRRRRRGRGGRDRRRARDARLAGAVRIGWVAWAGGDEAVHGQGCARVRVCAQCACVRVRVYNAHVRVRVCASCLSRLCV